LKEEKGGTMKSILFCLALAVTSAQAGLIVSTQNTDLTAYGFGVAPAILTLQRATLEEGCVVPTNNAGGFSTSCVGGPAGYTDLASSLVNGNNKYATPTLTALGVTSFSNLAILFNVNEPGSSQQVTLQNLTLTLYNGTTPVFTFGLNDPTGSGPTDLIDIAQGQGSAGFLITIAPQELPLANQFSGNLRVGLAATIGCTAAAGCDVPGQFGTADGPESFTIANVPVTNPVPEPISLLTLGSGLVGLGILRSRRSGGKR
jgi:hypothetical protein